MFVSVVPSFLKPHPDVPKLIDYKYHNCQFTLYLDKTNCYEFTSYSSRPNYFRGINIGCDDEIIETMAKKMRQLESENVLVINKYNAQYSKFKITMNHELHECLKYFQQTFTEVTWCYEFAAEMDSSMAQHISQYCTYDIPIDVTNFPLAQNLPPYNTVTFIDARIGYCIGPESDDCSFLQIDNSGDYLNVFATKFIPEDDQQKNHAIISEKPNMMLKSILKKLVFQVPTLRYGSNIDLEINQSQFDDAFDSDKIYFCKIQDEIPLTSEHVNYDQLARDLALIVDPSEIQVRVDFFARIHSTNYGSEQ